MIGLAIPSLPITTLKRLLRDRFMDADERLVFIVLSSFADDDGQVVITEAELAYRAGVPAQQLRNALGTLWARRYVVRLDEPDPDGHLQITIRPEGGVP